ncbi:MAG: hypothetical protein KC415_22105 [Anaerolineales bacterium]|nr:hypothetical protein [Anaerolineales bacterium]MCB9004141.1 hypothetical protein [Ardenticatenaceae bacterium]
MSEFVWQRRVLRWGVGVGLGTAVLLIILIASGLFDPKPVGPFQPAINLTLTIPEEGRAVRWLDAPLPPGDFSVRLMVESEGAGEQGCKGDIFTPAPLLPCPPAFPTTGLLLGSAPLWVGVSPLGYVEIMDGETAVLPLQTWVHVRPSANEIWVDMRDETMTVRVNRELLWQGEVTLMGRQVGISGEGKAGVVNGQLSMANGQ